MLSLFGYLGFIFPWLVLYGGWLVFANIDRPAGDALSKSVRAASLLLWLISGCGLAWLALGANGDALPQGNAAAAFPEAVSHGRGRREGLDGRDRPRAPAPLRAAFERLYLFQAFRDSKERTKTKTLTIETLKMQ